MVQQARSISQVAPIAPIPGRNTLLTLTLTLALVLVLVLGSYSIPLYPYAWETGARFASQPDTDAALVIVWLAAAALIVAIAAFLRWSRRSPTFGLLFLGLVSAAVWRLVQSLPAYAG
jgi:hypothetical protein